MTQPLTMLSSCRKPQFSTKNPWHMSHNTSRKSNILFQLSQEPAHMQTYSHRHNTYVQLNFLNKVLKDIQRSLSSKGINCNWTLNFSNSWLNNNIKYKINFGQKFLFNLTVVVLISVNSRWKLLDSIIFPRSFTKNCMYKG